LKRAELLFLEAGIRTHRAGPPPALLAASRGGRARFPRRIVVACAAFAVLAFFAGGVISRLLATL
jgi:hypothetical protein